MHVIVINVYTAHTHEQFYRGIYTCFAVPIFPKAPFSSLPWALHPPWFPLWLFGRLCFHSFTYEGNIGSVFLYLSLVLFTMVTSCYSFSCKWQDFAFPNGGVESHCLYSHMLSSGTHLPMGEDDSTACLSWIMIK